MDFRMVFCEILCFYTLQENYCDALTQVFNETSLKEVDINNLLEISIASDAIGGGKQNTLHSSFDKLPPKLSL